MDQSLEPIYRNVINGDADQVHRAVNEQLRKCADPEVILNTAMIPAMDEVGRLYEIGEYFVPEMLLAARAMKAGMKILKPKLIEKGAEPVGKILIGTVQGDIHDIGKNLVIIMLEGAGFAIDDIGVDQSPDAFVNALKKKPADILAMSSLITPTMASMKATIDALNDSNLKGQVKILIGGAPVTQEFADNIGADGYAPDAGKAVLVAKAMLRG